MSNLNNENLNKIDEYFRIIRERILAPLENTEILNYSTATLLILFAAIDGLGKLLHPGDNAGPGDRIRGFLDYMGDGYKIHKDELYNLRCSLVHNAINVASFLSRTEITREYHLEQIGSEDYIHVNTIIMYEDLVKAINKLQEEIKNDPSMLQQAADRLEWRHIPDWEEWRDNKQLDDLNIAIPSPPPPIEFIRAK